MEHSRFCPTWWSKTRVVSYVVQAEAVSGKKIRVKRPFNAFEKGLHRIGDLGGFL